MRNKSGINCLKKHYDRTYNFQHVFDPTGALLFFPVDAVCRATLYTIIYFEFRIVSQFRNFDIAGIFQSEYLRTQILAYATSNTRTKINHGNFHIKNPIPPCQFYGRAHNRIPVPPCPVHTGLADPDRRCQISWSRALG